MLKKIALAALIGAALISAAGCGSSDKKAEGAASGSKKVTIGFSVSTQNNPFFVTMANSVKAAADKAGVNVKSLMHRMTRLSSPMILPTCSREISPSSS